MCARPQLLGAGFLLLAPLTLHANDKHGIFPGADPMQQCYGAAMVGMDSVINARLGVLAENGVELARNIGMNAALDEAFSTDLLNTIFNAYLWEGTPHNYAISVFYQCAQRGIPVWQANTQ